MNFLTVKVTKVPGAMQTITLEEGATVADALRIANITAESGYEIRVDNEVASIDQTLDDGAVVIVTKMIKGN